MTVVRSAGQLDLRRWDALQPPGGFFATSPWLLHAERTARVPPYYLTFANGHSAMPAYPLDSADPYVFCRVDHVLRQVAGQAFSPDGLLPVLACGPRNPGYTFIATRPEIDPPAISRVVQEAEALAEEAGLNAVSYLYVRHSDTLLSQELAQAGYVPFPGKTEYVLDVSPNFEAYLGNFSSHRRSTIRCEMRQLKQAGVAFRTEPLTSDLASRLAPLEAQLYARYGTPGDERTLGAIMTSIAANLAGHVEVVLAEFDGSICGFTIVLSRGNEFYARQTGYDYHLKGRLPVYFAVVYYELIRLAQQRGISTIYYGTGAGETKLSRGCRGIQTRAWVKSFDPPTYRELARLMAL